MKRPVAVGPLLAAMLALLLVSRSLAAADAPRPVTVTSFNIRYGTARDGDNRWERRRELVLGVLRDGGDVLGLQEALPFQVQEIAAALPGFAVESRTREKDPVEGEACPIFWRTERFEADPTDRGTFWLSEAPQTPGSRSWDAALPRIATFVRLVDRADGRGLYVFNTHLDHRGETAREESARLLARRIAERKRPDEPVVLLGDLNDGPGSVAVRTLVSAGLRDAWRDANPAAPEAGTFNGWNESPGAERIDFVLATDGLVAMSAEIDTRRPDGRWPSDHLPVRSGFLPRFAAPDIAERKPAEFPGLQQVVAYVPGIWSGAAPEGQAAFESLRRLGVRTIVSVDGAVPEVDLARAVGIRYVHLPIGYDGMSHDRTLEIARAIRDLPGPVYVHCHHGKHRSAAAVGAAAVTLGLADAASMRSRMEVSGTAPSYTGLFRCVEAATVATPAALDAAEATFPPIAATPDLVKAMVEIDLAFEHLKDIEQAGWKVPDDHPDLVPAAEAGRLADLLRNLAKDPAVAEDPADHAERYPRIAAEVSELERALVRRDREGGVDPAELSRMLKGIAASCKECHVRHRD